MSTARGDGPFAYVEADPVAAAGDFLAPLRAALDA